MKSKNAIQVFTHEIMPGLAVIRAAYVQQRFPKHWHETYSLGVILSGVNRFMHRGSYQYATINTLFMVNPGEVHTGETCTENGWEYLNILPTPDLLAKTQHAMDMPVKSVYFPTPVIADKPAVNALQRFALAVVQALPAMEVEQKWFTLCENLFSRHAEKNRELKALPLPHAISQAREVLDSHISDNLSLSALAKICAVSPFHLARSFTHYVGVPPHAYHLQKRIAHAKTLIQRGDHPLAEVAVATGFADQAHMTRLFRRYHGATPGQFQIKFIDSRKNIQDDSTYFE